MNSPFATLAPDGRTVFWYQSDSHARTLEEAEKTAARKRHKEEKAMPLFAPVIETVSSRLKTPEQIIDEDEHRWDKLAAHELEQYQKVLELRAVIGEIVSADELKAMDDRRFAAYPPDVTYSWGFWFARIKEIRPEAAYEICLNRERHTELSRWHEKCPACGMQLTTADPQPAEAEE